MTVVSLDHRRTNYTPADNPKGAAVGGGTGGMREVQSLGVCLPVLA
jgi:hypothetical protein